MYNLKKIAFLFKNGVWGQEHFMLKSENHSSRNQDRFDV